MLGAIETGGTHPFKALHFRQHIARHVIPQHHLGEFRITGSEDGNHQDVGVGLFDNDALLVHGLGQARHGSGELVLDLDLRHVRVGTGLKGQGNQGATIGLTGRLHIHQVVDTVELVLDDIDHRLLDHARRSTGVIGGDADGRGRHLRIVGHRQLIDGDHTGDADKQGNYPGKDGPVSSLLIVSLLILGYQGLIIGAGRLLAERTLGCDRIHFGTGLCLEKAVHHHLLTGLKPLGDDPVIVAGTGYGHCPHSHHIIRPHQQQGIAVLAAGNGLLGNQKSVGITRLFHHDPHIHTRQ